MRRLPGILLLTVATLIVVVALLVSGLRLVLPQLNSWRPQVLEKVSAMAGVPVENVIRADEVTNVRAFGTESDLEMVQNVVNARQAKQRRRIEITQEYHRIGAVRGQVLDADGQTRKLLFNENLSFFYIIKGSIVGGEPHQYGESKNQKSQ